MNNLCNISKYLKRIREQFLAASIKFPQLFSCLSVGETGDGEGANGV